jgi:FixJ family two-component response regulator
MSGYPDDDIVRHGVLEPDIDLLAKPFTAEALLSAMDKAMARGAAD